MRPWRSRSGHVGNGWNGGYDVIIKFYKNTLIFVRMFLLTSKIQRVNIKMILQFFDNVKAGKGGSDGCNLLDFGSFLSSGGNFLRNVVYPRDSSARTGVRHCFWLYDDFASLRVCRVHVQRVSVTVEM